MKNIKFLFLLTMFSVEIVSAQTFSPNDVRIGDTTVNYVNPELSPTGNYMIWIEIDTANGVSGNVWQCGIDPNTGDLIPSDGKGFNPFYSNVYARPADWGVDSIGAYYVGATFAGQIKFVRPSSPTSATVTNISMPVINKRRVFYPSQLPGVNKRFVSYILNDSVNGFSSTVPQNTFYQLRLLDLDNTANDYLIEQQPSIYPSTVPMDVIVPRWIKGSSYLTFGYKDINNKAQAKEFNAYAPTSSPIPVTNDLSNKVDGYPVLNSITGEQYFMSGINATDTAYFYKRTSFGSTFVQNEIVVPQTVNLQTASFNQSHEPFFFNGQLYSTFQINNNGGNFFETTFNQPGEIWMTTIDSSSQTMWLLSEFDSTLSISEPEPYIGNNKVWVYFSAVDIDTTKPYLKRQFQLRRCETPMNTTVGLNEILGDNSSIIIFPNPTNSTLQISSKNQLENYTVELINSMGQQIGSYNNPTLIDLSTYSNGVYFIKVQSGNQVFTKKIIKQ